MARSPDEVYEAKMAKAKDKVRVLDRQLSLARLEAGRVMVEAVSAGVKRTTISTWWNTSTQQIDRMMARAKASR